MEKTNVESSDKFEIYNVILDYVKNGTYPSGYNKDEKRKVRSRAKRFGVSSGGKLIYQKNGTPKEVVMDAADASKILYNFHDLRGHLGRDKTSSFIEDTYFWDGMCNDIDIYVKSCEKCQLVNCSQFDKRTCELHPIPVKSPWHHIGMDLIMLPESRNGNKYVFTMCDYFTKWPEAVALRDKSAESVSLALYQVCLRMGFPSIYSSDQGREFVNKVMDVFKNISKSEQRISTAYHPQTNGLVERFNQTLQRMLLKCCNSINQDDWDEYIDECLYSYRTSVQSSTKVTPFEAMFGRKSVIVTSSNLGEESEIFVQDEEADEKNVHVALKELQEHRGKLFAAIKENVNLAQAKQRKQYDSKINKGKSNLKKGDTVLLYNSKKASRKGSKLENTWTGPYIIEEELGKNVYRLNSQDGVTLKKKYNGSLLKRYHKRDEFLNCVQKRLPLKKRFWNQSSSKPTSSVEATDDNNEVQITAFSSSEPYRYFTLPSDEQKRQMATKLGINVLGVHNEAHDICNPSSGEILGPPKCIVQVEGDGNCFFRCISYIVCGTESFHQEVRNSIVNYITNDINQQIFQNYLCVKDITDYVMRKKMNHSGTWATDVEVIATASLLQTDIEIFTKTGNLYKWLRYPASFTHDKYTPCALYLVNEEVHFNVVTSV